MTSYKGYRIEVSISTKGSAPLFVYDIHRGAQHLLAGFSYTDVTQDSVLDRCKRRVEELIVDADAREPRHDVHQSQRIRRTQGYGVSLSR